MRLFIGIPLPPAVQNTLWEKGQELKENSSRCRLTAATNFHLTLHFLGEYSPATLPILSRVLLVTAKNTQAFPLQLHGWGSFPRGQESVVWAGVTGDLAPLTLLQQELTKNLAKAKFPPEERPYHPHVTIGRQVRLQATLTSFSPITESCTAQSIALYHSHRDYNHKLIYEILQEVPLMPGKTS